MRPTALLATLLVAAACTTEEASRVAGDPTPNRSAEPGRHDVDADGWFLRSIDEDGKSIAFVYTMSGVASGCEQEGTSYAEESEDEVVVHAVKSVIDDRNRPCTEELAYVDATVTLRDPLGDRLLLGCLQTWEQDEFPEAAGGKDEDRRCRDTSRGDSGVPPSEGGGGDY